MFRNLELTLTLDRDFHVLTLPEGHSRFSTHFIGGAEQWDIYKKES